MRWTLEEVRRIEVHELQELIAWLGDQAKQANGEQSVDMDEVIKSQLQATREDD